MLKYKVISKKNQKLKWNVRIINKLHPTVGDYIKEIKKSKNDLFTVKTIWIYKDGNMVGVAVFEQEQNVEWKGAASEFWSDLVEKCEMTAEGSTSYTYKIYIVNPQKEVKSFSIFELFSKLIIPKHIGGFA